MDPGLRRSQKGAHYFENQHFLKFRKDSETSGNSWLTALRTSSLIERSSNGRELVADNFVADNFVAEPCRSNFAAEREKQTRKQLEDVVAPNAQCERSTRRPEHLRPEHLCPEHLLSNSPLEEFFA